MILSDVSLSVVLSVFVAFLFGFLFGRILRAISLRKERSDATKRSRSTILWELYEKILPFIPGFPYAPKDLVFIGKGFDYLVIDGLSEGAVREIIFLEVKTGTSGLNHNERSLRDAVKARKVRWLEYRPDKQKEDEHGR